MPFRRQWNTEVSDYSKGFEMLPTLNLKQFHVPQEKLTPLGASVRDADLSKVVINGTSFMLRIEDETIRIAEPRSQLFSLDRENGPNATKLCPSNVLKVLAPFLPKQIK